MSTEDATYLEGRVHQHLAENPDTAELGVRVAVHGDAVYLTGDVPSDERRRRIVAAVRSLVTDRDVRDELAVTSAEAPVTQEDLP
jgi:osmotically-inducible protein OsmY